MIYVYLWNFSNKSNVGHLSMQLSNGTYISFWPQDQVRGPFHAVRSEGSTYQDDVEAEGRYPDEVLDLPDDIVDQEKIKWWWRNNVGSTYYQLFGQNCARAVRAALIEGGIDDGGTALAYLKTFDQSYSLTAELFKAQTPYHTLEWIKECKALYVLKHGFC